MSESDDVLSDFEQSSDAESQNGVEDMDVPHFTVSFFSNDKKIATKLNDDGFSIPSTSDPTQLNALVNQTLDKAFEEEDGLWEDQTFDFLIGPNFVRERLNDYVEATGISTESVIRIECVIREPAPEPDQDMPHVDWVGTVRVTDKIIISSTYNGFLYFWTHDGKPLLKEQVKEDEPIRSVDVAKDNRVFAGLQNSDIAVYEVDVIGKIGALKVDATRVATFKGHERSVNCLAVNEDGSRLVSGGFDNRLKVWNIEPDDETTLFVKQKDSSKKRKTNIVTKVPMVTLEGHKDAITATAWMPDVEGEVVTASWDQNLVVWDLSLAGQKTRMPSQKPFAALSVNFFNKTIITGSTDPTVRLWDPRSHEGSFVKQSFVSHGGWVTDVCWSTTREHLFISSSNDKTVMMWDIRSAKTPLYTLKGHTDRVLCCDWSNPEIMASGGVDSTLKTFRR